MTTTNEILNSEFIVKLNELIALNIRISAVDLKQLYDSYWIEEVES